MGRGAVRGRAPMQLRPDWVPETIDVEQPSAARIYDYLLGGSHNFAADRDVARQAAPGARVVYVDLDPVAVAHSRAILAGTDRVTVIQEDLRHPTGILGHPDLKAVLDLDAPVAVLLVAILHVIPDGDDPYRIVSVLRDPLAPGSWLAIAHGTDDSRPAEAEELRRLSQKTATPLTLRSRAEVQRFFAGWDLVEPGLVWAPQWHPDSPDDVGEHPELSSNLVGLGRTK